MFPAFEKNFSLSFSVGFSSFSGGSRGGDGREAAPPPYVGGKKKK